ncbi:Uncharacterised protein [Mycobacterium tuberculosis]|uniref:Uncharacterized protein n=1 Tax=Mycobacterium tuberculosis TaxID=1773 RepID=A0A0T7LR59_MYCTX|nr:Uncharacterised protein [Mycobacterium tuberculosis]CKR23051.1 Uncharacterised protein [Mycobacterium tuberculosis]CKR32053.1 Uncharacterised protein [Mycobacterium tuberculosis]CKR59537.1 Uncharacterised protein [Mycobacterium tuberculosis]CKR79442.1 Uncharacterised protein [Mycobacterium tuberculosis]
MADENQCDLVGLGGSGQGSRNRTDLRDPAGDAVGLAGGHGLHRVDDDQCRLHRLDLVEHGVHVGLCGEVDLLDLRAAADPVGTQPDLTGGFLTRDIERAPSGLGPAVRDLEQQRRLTHSGIAGQQCHRTGNDTAT